MTLVLQAENVRSEVIPGVGFNITSMKVHSGKLTGVVISDPRLRNRMVSILDRSQSPTSGKVMHFDKKGKPGKLRISSLSIDRCYLGDMTIREYLDHYRSMAGLELDENERNEILSSLNLLSFLNCRTYGLPYEGHVYIELARCLYCRPELLIMDLSGLPLGIGGDTAFSSMIMRYLSKNNSACIVIGDGSIMKNRHFKKVFYYQLGEMIEDSDREKELRSLDWKKYMVGVEDLGNSISLLEKMENVEVLGSLKDQIRVAVGNDLEISDINKRLVDSGMKVTFIIPSSDTNREGIL